MKLCVYHTGSTCKDTGKSKPPEACLNNGCDGRIVGEAKCGAFHPKVEVCNNLMKSKWGDFCGTIESCKQKEKVQTEHLKHLFRCRNPMTDRFSETGKAMGCLE